MPRQRPGYTQVPFEMPDELLAEVRAAAEEAGQKLTAWICTACAERIGAEYTPPKLGRPATPPPPPPKKRGRPRKVRD